MARVAYVSDERTDEVLELFSVPVDGSAAPVVVSAPMPVGGDAMDFAQVSGERVLYRAEQLTNGVVELFVVPDDGSAPPVRLSGPLVVGGDVNAFLAGEEQVIYQADAVVDGRDELYSVALDGSSPPIALAPGLDVPGLVQLSRDGRLVMFATLLGEERLHIVPADGSAPPFDLVGSGFSSGGGAVPYFSQIELTGDGEHVVFQTAEDEHSISYGWLWSVRLDGTALVKLSSGGLFPHVEFQLAPDASRVFYVDSGATRELVSARVDGTSSHLLTPGLGTPGLFRISDDSAFCVFTESEAGLMSLRLARLDGSTSCELLAPAPGLIVLLELVNDSTTIVFLRGGVLHSLATPGVAVPFSGAGVISGPMFGYPSIAFSGDGRLALYRSDEALAGVWELYCAPLDGSQPARRLNPPLSAGRNVTSFRLAPGGQVLFRADQATDDKFALFGVALDGSGSVRELNGALAAGRDVGYYGQPQRVRRPLQSP
jgi:hypothetical protein